MNCRECGSGRVEWKGPLTALTHTECADCGATDCHEPEGEAEDIPETDAGWFERASITMHGPAVTPEMQMLFGPYACGATVTAVVVERLGLKVGYADGSETLFVAVPDGSALVARPDGKLEVRS